MGDKKNERQHAKFAASASHRWLNCPGSIALSEKAPAQKPSSHSIEGTKAHQCLEAIIRGIKPSYLKRSYTEDMISHALDAWHEIESHLANAPHSVLITEGRVTLEHIRSDMFGTLDCAIVEEFGELRVFDYKYGFNAVEVEENTQMIFYALALAHEYNYNFSHVVLGIIQPRAEHPKGPNRYWRIEIDTLKRWAGNFRLASILSENENPPLKTGRWCKYCPAAVICPEISKKAMVSAQIAFAPEKDMLKLPDPTSFQIQNLGQILIALEKIDFWATEVRMHAFHCAERGEKVAGWKLVQKRSIRKWHDGVESLVIKKFGDKAFKKELLSPAQFEKTVSDMEFLKDNCSSISSGRTLVPESDNRPSIDAISEAFKD